MKMRKRERPIEAYAAGFFLAVLVILLTVQILLRFIFGRTLSWSEEVSRFAFVWAVYFGFVLAARENKHIRVTAQFKRLSSGMQLVLFTLADTVWSLFNFVMVFVSGKFTLSMIRYPYISQTTGLNLLWVFMIVPIGFAFMGLRVIQVMISRIKGRIAFSDSRLDV